MEDRSEDRDLATRTPEPLQPDPAPLPGKVPGPIPWIPTQPSERPDVTHPGWASVQEAPTPVSCFWCDRLHRGDHALSVCPACTARYSTLRSLEMSGIYQLNDQAIDEVLTCTSPGNYALGYLDGDAFDVFYVGRSDCDVRRRLHEWVDRPSRYTSYASPAKAPWGVHRRGRRPVDAPALRRVGTAEASYTRFAYSYARSAEEAYAKEWRNYDAFGGSRNLDNESQPATMAG